MTPYHHVQRADETDLESPADLAAHSSGFRTAALVGRQVESVHTGFTLCSLDPGGHVDTHLHSTEQSFYVLAGGPQLTVDGRTYGLAANECGLVPVGVPHAWNNEGDGDAVWIAVNSPAPRLSGQPDTFWTGDPAPTAPPPRRSTSATRALDPLRLGAGEMDVDNLKIGAAVDARRCRRAWRRRCSPTAGSPSDARGRAPGAVCTRCSWSSTSRALGAAHDHPFEETYYVLEGDVDAVADGEEFTLHAGDCSGPGSLRSRLLQPEPGPGAVPRSSRRYRRELPYRFEPGLGLPGVALQP